MQFESLRHAVLDANLEIVRRGLVLYTFGNASGIDRASGAVAIKPSGVDYDKLRAEDIVITDLDGKIIDGKLKPSSDLATHLHLYREFAEIGGIVHTHSEFATAWAQAQMEIPCFGTTHADYFHGPVPVTASLTAEQIESDYVHQTGVAIVDRFKKASPPLNPASIPGCLVAGHAPFAWGNSAAEAAYHAVVLESIARIAYYTRTLHAECPPISQSLHNRHFLRKHGTKATYGQ